mgnify:CR=1 FL=1
MSVSGQLACGRLSTAKDGCRSCAESGASNAEGCATLQVCATLLRKATVRVGTGADGGWGGYSRVKESACGRSGCKSGGPFRA